jgi:hypothetical protein
LRALLWSAARGVVSVRHRSTDGTATASVATVMACVEITDTTAAIAAGSSKGGFGPLFPPARRHETGGALTLPRITLGRFDESRQSFGGSLSAGAGGTPRRLTFERYWDLPVEARTERSSIGRMPVGSIRGRLLTRPSHPRTIQCTDNDGEPARA